MARHRLNFRGGDLIKVDLVAAALVLLSALQFVVLLQLSVPAIHLHIVLLQLLLVADNFVLLLLPYPALLLEPPRLLLGPLPLVGQLRPHPVHLHLHALQGLAAALPLGLRLITLVCEHVFLCFVEHLTLSVSWPLIGQSISEVSHLSLKASHLLSEQLCFALAPLKFVLAHLQLQGSCTGGAVGLLEQDLGVGQFSTSLSELTPQGDDLPHTLGQLHLHLLQLLLQQRDFPRLLTHLRGGGETCFRIAAHLPLALLQSRPQLDLIVLIGGAALLQLLPLLQKLSKVLLQLLLLLLQLINLQSLTTPSYPSTGPGERPLDPLSDRGWPRQLMEPEPVLLLEDERPLSELECPCAPTGGALFMGSRVWGRLRAQAGSARRGPPDPGSQLSHRSVVLVVSGREAMRLLTEPIESRAEGGALMGGEEPEACLL
ncbi:hypothetical protein F7725_014564 [Dissostichus mawsoni]|uniref:Uncharacterized protein n=1 Tax=Dissostichus mawsoni TaxID=36200 RepID=A0A7J5YWT1_DISMA|nr:hypothetical protein F7725_014564 [Dissostichus mawsoni]